MRRTLCVHRLRSLCSVFRAVSATPCTRHNRASRTRSVCSALKDEGQVITKCKSVVNLAEAPSVLRQVGGVPGWQALLSAVGFRLDFSGSSSALPAAVFFPTSDPGDRLQQCSTTLQSLLGSLQKVFRPFNTRSLCVKMMTTLLRPFRSDPCSSAGALQTGHHGRGRRAARP